MTKTQPEDSTTEHAPPKDSDYGPVEPDPKGYQISPDDPDYDLSESAGAADWLDDDSPRTIIPHWLVALVSALLILALTVPLVLSLR